MGTADGIVSGHSFVEMSGFSRFKHYDKFCEMLLMVRADVVKGSEYLFIRYTPSNKNPTP